MSEREKKNLFKLFATMNSTRESNTQGVGLGLCISKMIVEFFGGEISVESKPDEGATFTFTFEMTCVDRVKLIVEPIIGTRSSEQS